MGQKDLLILLGAWGLCPNCGAQCVADIDCDCNVGQKDLLILEAAWGPVTAAMENRPTPWSKQSR